MQTKRHKSKYDFVGGKITESKIKRFCFINKIIKKEYGRLFGDRILLHQP